MRSLRGILFSLAHHTTVKIGVRYGDRFPMHFVCGYPRSGTTWLSELLADYLNIPRPSHYMLPLAFECVVHTHVELRSGLRDCFYIVRDGRDVMISLYFYFLDQRDHAEMQRRGMTKRLFGDDFDPKDTAKNLPRFLESQFEHPISTRSNWAEHTVGWVRQAKKSPGKIVVVYYEQLSDDPSGTFIKALEEKYGEFEPELVRESVNRQNFQKQFHRKKSQHRTVMRKGITGDWCNYFTPECKQIFDHYAGEALIELAYEADHTWTHDGNRR